MINPTNLKKIYVKHNTQIEEITAPGLILIGFLSSSRERELTIDYSYGKLTALKRNYDNLLRKRILQKREYDLDFLIKGFSGVETSRVHPDEKIKISGVEKTVQEWVREARL